MEIIVIQQQYSQTNIRRIYLVCLLALVFLAGCAGSGPQPQPSIQPQAEQPTALENQPPRRIETRPRSSLSPLASLKPKIAAAEKMPYESKLFSLSARSTPLRDVLLGLSKQAELNLVIEKGVDSDEPVSVELYDLPISTVLDMILNAYGYFYDIDGNILRIKAMETKIFHFDYPLMVNTPTSNVGGDMLSSRGGSNNNRRSNSKDENDLKGEFSIETSVDSSALDLWKQLEQALKGGSEGQHGLLSEQGRMQINRLAGTIMITDRRENLLLIEEYFNELEKVLSRQVTIEAKILEVTLSDSFRYGIKWDVLAQDLLSSSGGDLQFISDFTTGGGNITLEFFNDTGNNIIGGFLEALSAQGNVNVLASPRISAVNNQTALITVARNIPYIDWQLSSIQDPNDQQGRLTQLVPTMQNTQVGISLGVTPQIDANGVATLHIVPVITDLVGFKQFTQDGDSWDIPIIDMRATDSIVRARNGSTIILGGLILERMSEDSTGIPVLGDIPYLGQILFSGQVKDSEKRELVIMLNPTIIEQ
jgi:MSHA type pilus biogenesis protein MshL